MTLFLQYNMNDYVLDNMHHINGSQLFSQMVILCLCWVSIYLTLKPLIENASYAPLGFMFIHYLWMISYFHEGLY